MAAWPAQAHSTSSRFGAQAWLHSDYALDALAGDLLLQGWSLILVTSTSLALCSLQTQNSPRQGVLQSNRDQGLQCQAYGHRAYELPTVHPASASMKTGIQKPIHMVTIGE